MENDDVPDTGDVLWIDFGPPVGHEQGGRRPGLVLTSRRYNAVSSMFVVCPITRTGRNWPFQVALPHMPPLSGYVLVDQIKAIDPARRAFKVAGRVSEATLEQVRVRLALLLGIGTDWRDA